MPFKDQKSADVVRRELSDLGKKINSDLRPVFTSRKIADDIKVAEAKPPLINQQCIVYKFKCDLCDDNLNGILKLKYPESVINSTLTRFIESRNQQQVHDVQANAPVRIIMPFKNQRSADVVRRHAAVRSWKEN